MAWLKPFTLKQLIAKAYNRYMTYEVNYLKELPILSQFKKASLVKMIAKMHLRQVCKEALIFKEGSSAQHLYVVTHGEIELLKSVHDHEIVAPKSSALELSAFQHRQDNYN